ncbi:MAG: flavin reductase family protein [Massiliimalia sp.]|jgi:flavin reductase (DIM6/NTAB) family NADH-FMN oxidoreductase RutF
MKESWKGGALLAPLPPVMVSCGTVDHPNVLTIAWTGIINTKPSKTYISVRPSRYSYNIIKESGEFVINLTTKDLVWAADFCGVRSGRDLDKFSICHLTPEASAVVSAPAIKESPLSIECRVSQIIPLGTHDMFLADVVAVNVDSRCLDEKGALRLDRCGLAAFAHGEYFELGKSLGTFGFSVKNRPLKKEKKQAQSAQKERKQSLPNEKPLPLRKRKKSAFTKNHSSASSKKNP